MLSNFFFPLYIGATLLHIHWNFSTVNNILALFILLILCMFCQSYTESSKYYARPQTAVARGLDLPTCGLAGRQDWRCFQTFTVLFQFIFRVYGHVHELTFAKRKHKRLLIVIIVRR